MYTLSNLTSTCYDSSAAPSGGGTPAWVWGVVGAVLGCAALGAVGAAFLWRARRRRQRPDAGGGALADAERGDSKHSSGVAGSLAGTGSDDKPHPLAKLSGTLSGALSGGLSVGPHSGSGETYLMRTR